MPMDVQKFEFLQSLIEDMTEFMEDISHDTKECLLILMFRFSGVRGDNMQWDDIRACPTWENPDEAFTETKEWLVRYFKKHTLSARDAKEAEEWLMAGCPCPEDDLLTMEPGTNATYRAMFAPCLPFGQEEIQLAGAAPPVKGKKSMTGSQIICHLFHVKALNGAIKLAQLNKL